MSIFDKMDLSQALAQVNSQRPQGVPQAFQRAPQAVQGAPQAAQGIAVGEPNPSAPRVPPEWLQALQQRAQGMPMGMFGPQGIPRFSQDYQRPNLDQQRAQLMQALQQLFAQRQLGGFQGVPQRPQFPQMGFPPVNPYRNY